jgi:hypothetical protein
MLEIVPDIAQSTHGNRNIFADIRNVPTRPHTVLGMFLLAFSVVANLMPLFCFMFIQGEQLLSASGYGDMATVRLLLEGDPNLVRYKNSVRRTE